MGDIKFRRIHGRIVPIKMTQHQQRQGLQGTGLAAAGIGIAAGAGKIYRAANQFASSKSARAFRSLERLDRARFKLTPQGSLFGPPAREKGTKKVLELTGKMFKASNRISQFAPALRLGSIAAGSALIGAGAAKLYKASGQKSSKTNKAQSAAIGTAVGTGAFLTGAYGGAGLRSALKGPYVKAYPAIRALKLKLKL